jgi:hypothetical protein
LFGAAGTVLGAALGSVVSTLAAAVYEHSLDRTRDTVKARIKLPGGRTVDVAGKVEVPAPRVAAGGEAGQAHVFVTPAESTNRRRTMVLPSVSPASPARPLRRWVALTALAFGVFLLGLLAVTGVELLKGSTLTRGETGTSVGRVVDPRPVSAEPTEPTEAGSTTTETAERTETPATSTTESTTEATATESVTDEPDGGTGRTAGGSTDAPEDSSVDDEADVGATSAATPTPTPTRSPDGD